MDRTVQRELEITGSMTTELQLTAPRRALSNRKTRKTDNTACREAGETMEILRAHLSGESKAREGKCRNRSEAER